MTDFTMSSRVFVAGHRGLVGSAIERTLRDAGFADILTAPRDQLDLRDPAAVRSWFDEHRPEFVFLAAGKVGGIAANHASPADFLYDNMMIHTSVIEAAHRTGVTKLLYLGSSCIYPRDAPQPIPEESLLTGPLETTNEAYAMAKIAGIKMCDSYRRQHGSDFISAMPTNLYGPGDNFDLETSHVLPALMRKFHEAKQHGSTEVEVWGTGTPRREFLHVDDLADACIYLMGHYSEPGPINVGTGRDIEIGELAKLVGSVVYPEATIRFDPSRPDGTPRKVLDVTKLNDLGWTATTSLDDGLRATYQWFIEHEQSARGVTN